MWTNIVPLTIRNNISPHYYGIIFQPVWYIGPPNFMVLRTLGYLGISSEVWAQGPKKTKRLMSPGGWWIFGCWFLRGLPVDYLNMIRTIKYKKTNTRSPDTSHPILGAFWGFIWGPQTALWRHFWSSVFILWVKNWQIIIIPALKYSPWAFQWAILDGLTPCVLRDICLPKKQRNKFFLGGTWRLMYMLHVKTYDM